MTDRELFEMALDDLDWAKLMLNLYENVSHKFLDETIAAIKQRLENND